ncbi:WD40/YVTN/BNR-like repeat-containing protein [Alicyclobacillus mengziensis]|uniref:Sortilin N-terminal domain-containing protein n=1 Tax=Alicyclobacillus mengziensis TaxID=2931921 RepID=A0A9X7W133_9BACL|nr:YCF48-related protein [Alicyclobacillus mengziensis]QSO48445.1 hypothetical protein JZ786_05505 [Alicyclobacillus mengziensis]
MKNKRLLLIGGVAGITLFTIVGCGSQPNVAPQNKTTAESSMNNTPSNTAKGNATNTVTQPSSSTQSQMPALTSINMVNSKTGWATGHNSVWFTKDGGVSWTQVTPKGLRASSNLQMKVYGIGDKNAWVATSDTSSISNPLSIYYTSNGGQTWVKQGIHDAGDPMSLHFRDQNHGWIALMQGAAMGSERETIYQTNDGGATWNKIAVTNDVKGGTLPFCGDKTGVSFIDNKHGWATGFTPANGHVYLYKTTDDGKDWVSQTLSVPSSVKGAQFTSYPPLFFGHQDGILPVSSGAELVAYRTTDGGKRWVPGKVVRSTVQNPAIQAWSFPTMNNGFATDGDKMFTTTDSGQTWTSFTSNIPLKNVTTMQFVSSTDGWAVISTGALYRTTDGGHTWSKMN